VDRRVRAYALSGLVTCGRCGDNVRSKTYASHDRAKRCYICRRRDAAGLCDEPRADADALEREILDWLRAIRVEPEWQGIYDAERSKLRTPATPTKTAAQRRREIETKIERKRVAWEAGAVSDEGAFRREIADLRLQLDAISTEAPKTTERRAASLSTLVDRWDEMRGDQRQSLLKSLIDEIVMRDGAIESAKPTADWMPHLEAVFAGCPAEGLVGRGPARGTRHIALANGRLIPAA
jgi:Recombinase zinc beta ribbon domain